MKELFFIGAAGILGVGFWMHNPVGATNVYNMPAEEVYKRLSAVQVEPSGTGPFGRLDTSTSGIKPKSVTWHATGSHANIECTAMIEAKSETATALNVSCDGASPSSGAATGMLMNMTRNAVIELVDSTLDGRPYDKVKAEGSSAFGWPEDPVHHAGFAEATGEAMKMDAEMRRMRDETERSAR